VEMFLNWIWTLFQYVCYCLELNMSEKYCVGV
jgi:hypothetical protein